jgi:hypothetical protein
MARSAPLVANFRVWLDAARARVSAKSRVGEKLGYFARHWDGPVLFLDDRHAPLNVVGEDGLSALICAKRVLDGGKIRS